MNMTNGVPVRWMGWLVGVLCVVALWVVVSASDRPLGAVWRVLVLLVLAPLLEEVVFRLGLQSALHLRGYSPSACIGAAAVAFVLAHMLARGPLHGMAVLPAGVLLGVVYQHRRQLASCVLMHAAMNALWLLWVTAGPAELQLAWTPSRPVIAVAVAVA